MNEQLILEGLPWWWFVVITVIILIMSIASILYPNYKRKRILAGVDKPLSDDMARLAGLGALILHGIALLWLVGVIS